GAAGVPLAIEHWPARLRGTASGLLQRRCSVGSVPAAAVYHFVYPLIDAPDRGWRVMFWIGVLPALLVVWIMSSVRESPVWLAEREQRRALRVRETMSLARLFG